MTLSATTTLLTANLRKGKTQTLSLLLFVLIAAMFLSLGLMMLLRFTHAFDQRGEALHAPHAVFVESESTYAQAHTDFLSSYPGVTETETVRTVAFNADMEFNGEPGPWTILLLDAAATYKMNGLTLIEGSVPSSDNQACVPYILKAGGGYDLGDTLTMTVGTTQLSYKISGFTEDLLFGPARAGNLQIYVSSGEYEKQRDAHPDRAGVIMRARMTNPDDATRLTSAWVQAFPLGEASGKNGWAWGTSYPAIKMLTTFLSSIIAAIIIAFSAVLGVVSLLLIRFRIRNSIEETMTNIGALKAAGYTGSQLLRATVLHFTTISLAGIIAGIGASYATLPFIAHVFEVQTALYVSSAFDPVSTMITLGVILAQVVLVTWLTARHIRTLSPLVALRQGLTTHSFKHNFFPLDRSAGPLSWLLALKSALHARGHTVMLFAIIAAVGFASGTGAAMYDNLSAHPEAFAKLLAGEPVDIMAIPQTADEARDLLSYTKSLPGVRKAYNYDLMSTLSDQLIVPTIVTEDFDMFEGSMLFQGRYPKHDNEMVVGAALAENLRKGIGDVTDVSLFGNSQAYLIVGLIQGADLVAAMTTPGYARLDPGFQPRMVVAYLKDNSKTEEFIESINDHFGKDAVACTDVHRIVESQLGQYASMFQVITVVILAVSLLVILLSVWLLMKTMILRRRREFGIQKTLGFTTRQLANQLALYFMPVIATGLVIGSIIGALSFNPIFVALTSGLGVRTAAMPIPYGLTLAMCAGLIVISYVFSLLVALRIRKIAVITLVTE